jgi:hypothetical protein
VRFQIDPTPEETARGCAALVSASLPAGRGNQIVIAAYVAVVVAAFVLARSTIAVTVFIGVGAVLGTTYALQAEARRRLRLLQGSDAHAKETYYIELTPEGVRTWCEHVDARYTWNGTTRVLETKEFYLLLRNSGSGLAIPKRVVSVESDSALRELFRRMSPDHGKFLRADGASGAAPAA